MFLAQPFAAGVSSLCCCGRDSELCTVTPPELQARLDNLRTLRASRHNEAALWSDPSLAFTGRASLERLARERRARGHNVAVE